MEQLDMFSLLSGSGRKELSFDELSRMAGRKIELVCRTASHEWSIFGRVMRVQQDADRRVLVYETADAGYGLTNEDAFSGTVAYPVRAYEVR